MIKNNKWLTRAGWLVYWIWHLIFVIVAVVILLPYITLPIINSVRIGAAPFHYAVYTSVMVTIPFLSLIIVWWKFRKDITAALKLFYAVELPLLLLLLLRIAFFRDAPLPAQILLCNISLGVAAYFCMLLYRTIPETQPGKYIDLILSTIIALVGTYLGLLLGLQFLPILLSLCTGIWQAIMGFSWSSLWGFFTGMSFNPLIILYVLLFFSTALFFLTTPLVLLFLYLHQFTQRIRVTSCLPLVIVVLGVLIVEGVIFNIGSMQPQHKAFNLTQNEQKSTSEQEVLLSQVEIIREGLLNAYLASYRYVSTTGSSQSLKKHYAETLGSNSPIAGYGQALFNGLAAPFMYQGDGFDEDRTLASLRYQEFFDTPIEKGERNSILAAVKATWENEQNVAGLMNAASHYVLLKNQAIDIEEHGDMATITITQILENQTFQPQEVLFHFSLPDDAVITGLWMSDEMHLPEKFPHVVSPRGAAQSVYKSEVNRRIDPALLEQVGPVQYRLRAFPIPARVVEQGSRRNRYSDTFRDFSVSPALVRFQYMVSINADGKWPMPKILEKRNVFWNEKTVRSHNIALPESWLPIAITASDPARLSKHVVSVSDRQIVAVPRKEKNNNRSYSTSAVIIDGSFSMNTVQEQVEEQIHWLEENNLAFDLFFCQNTCQEIGGSDVQQLTYFGNSQLHNQLSQFIAKTSKSSKSYSSIYVLTDTGSYELTPEITEVFTVPKQPLWLVHLHEKIPYAYSDEVIDWINDSQGGIARTLDEATNRYWWNLRIGEESKLGSFMGVSTNYFWYLQDGLPSNPSEEVPFTALAASRLLQYTAANSNKTQLAELDQIHNIAKTYDIVSFFSSMLVLVEDRQREMLKEAEASEDRFDREIETGSEILGKPTDAFAVPGVPEPEEWALIIIVGCLLSIAYRKKIIKRCRTYSLFQ